MGIGEIDLDDFGDAEASQTVAVPRRRPQRDPGGFQFSNQGSTGVPRRPCNQNRHPIRRLPIPGRMRMAVAVHSPPSFCLARLPARQRHQPGPAAYRASGPSHSAIDRSTSEQT